MVNNAPPIDFEVGNRVVLVPTTAKYFGLMGLVGTLVTHGVDNVKSVHLIEFEGRDLPIYATLTELVLLKDLQRLPLYTVV